MPVRRSNTNKPYILVVDDELETTRLIEMHLASEGYSVQTAITGEEAVRKVHDARPSLVILDIILPGMDGIETLKAILKHDKTIPVVIVTGIYDNEEGKIAFAAGARDYLTKPINFEYLKNTILLQSS